MQPAQSGLSDTGSYARLRGRHTHSHVSFSEQVERDISHREPPPETVYLTECPNATWCGTLNMGYLKLGHVYDANVCSIVSGSTLESLHAPAYVTMRIEHVSSQPEDSQPIASSGEGMPGVVGLSGPLGRGHEDGDMQHRVVVRFEARAAGTVKEALHAAVVLEDGSKCRIETMLHAVVMSPSLGTPCVRPGVHLRGDVDVPLDDSPGAEGEALRRRVVSTEEEL